MYTYGSTCGPDMYVPVIQIMSQSTVYNVSEVCSNGLRMKDLEQWCIIPFFPPFFPSGHCWCHCCGWSGRPGWSAAGRGRDHTHQQPPGDGRRSSRCHQLYGGGSSTRRGHLGHQEKNADGRLASLPLLTSCGVRYSCSSQSAKGYFQRPFVPETEHRSSISGHGCSPVFAIPQSRSKA